MQKGRSAFLVRKYLGHIVPVKYLGHIIESGLIRADPDRVEDDLVKFFLVFRSSPLLPGLSGHSIEGRHQGGCSLISVPNRGWGWSMGSLQEAW